MGMLTRFFKKKEIELAPLRFGEILKTDIHSHFIPGIDDGAKDMEDAINLILGMKDLGYEKVITTPHIMSDFYKNTPEIILSGLDALRKELAQRNIDIIVEAAAEYNMDADFESKIDADNLLTFGKNFVLFELPFIAEPPMIKELIWKMQTKGYQPVLAHVERYPYYHRAFEKIQDFVDRGVILQLNIGSLTGHYGPEIKAFSEKLIDSKLIGLLGSDCHHTGHIDMLKYSAVKPYLHKAIEDLKLINSSL